MPKRKLTIEEAFKVFEDAGLQIEVKGILPNRPQPKLSDFLEKPKEQNPYSFRKPTKVDETHIKITLYSKHTIGTAGSMSGTKGNMSIDGNTVQSYGPGVVVVPKEIAHDLLHQDYMARMT